MRRRSILTASLLAALLFPLGMAWAQSVPANFSQSTYKSGLSQITGMAWAKVTVTFAPCSARYRAASTPPPCRPNPITVTRLPASSCGAISSTRQ